MSPLSLSLSLSFPVGGTRRPRSSPGSSIDAPTAETQPRLPPRPATRQAAQHQMPRRTIRTTAIQTNGGVPTSDAAQTGCQQRRMARTEPSHRDAQTSGPAAGQAAAKMPQPRIGKHPADMSPLDSLSWLRPTLI